jgi:hypothetical protein
MNCPRCTGVYRPDDDLECPSLVCICCGYRLYCPKPPVTIKQRDRAEARFCQCGLRAKMKGRNVCKLCLSAIQLQQRKRKMGLTATEEVR